MTEQELNDIVCNQCNLKIGDSHQFIKVRPPSTIAYGCGHCVIDYFNGKIVNYILYWDTLENDATYKLEAPPNENQTNFGVYGRSLLRTPYPNEWELIKTFDYVMPLPIKNGVLEIDKLMQRLLNMKVFY